VILPHPPSRRRTTAFTLVELLVVVGIIALLISILLPALNKARQAANRVNCASQLRQTGQAFFVYAAEYGGRLPPFDWGHDWTKTPRLSFFPAQQSWMEDGWADMNSWSGPWYNNWLKENYSVFNVLVPRYVRDARILYCPSSSAATYPASFHAPYPSATRAGYTFELAKFGLINGKWRPRLLKISGRIDNKGAAQIAIGCDLSERNNNTYKINHVAKRRNGDATLVEGKNQLYLDGHVVWIPYSVDPAGRAQSGWDDMRGW
jgi:type II secretory pathway pseudopilin PulG